MEWSESHLVKTLPFRIIACNLIEVLAIMGCVVLILWPMSIKIREWMSPASWIGRFTRILDLPDLIENVTCYFYHGWDMKFLESVHVIFLDLWNCKRFPDILPNCVTLIPWHLFQKLIFSKILPHFEHAHWQICHWLLYCETHLSLETDPSCNAASSWKTS